MTEARSVKDRLRSLAIVIVVTLVVCYALGCAFLYGAQEKMIFIGAGEIAPLPAAPADWKRVELPHDEGLAVAWYYAQPTPGPAVIALHGNGESIAGWPGGMKPWQDRGYSILLPEIRGYAGVDGSPSQEKVTRDMVAWRDWLDARSEVASNGVVYYGYSLGGGIVSQLARRRRPAGMVLQSTFTDIRSLSPMWVPELLVQNPFDTASVLAELDIPIVVAHGTGDQVIPFSHGAKLAELADAPLISYEGGHHPPYDTKELWKAIDGALGDVGARLSRSEDP